MHGLSRPAPPMSPCSGRDTGVYISFQMQIFLVRQVSSILYRCRTWSDDFRCFQQVLVGTRPIAERKTMEPRWL